MYMEFNRYDSGGTEEQQVLNRIDEEEYAAKNSRKEKRYGLK